MNSIIVGLITKLINADRIGRWVQIAVAAAFPWLLLRLPFAQAFLTPELQGTIATALSIFFVGLWNEIAERWTAPNIDDAKKVTTSAINAGAIGAAKAEEIKAAVVADKHAPQ